MKNKNRLLAVLAATTTLSAAGFAYAESKAQAESKVEYKEDGGYESSRTSKHTDGKGTTTKTDANIDVDVHSKGNVSKTIKTTATTDPEGLMNEKKDDTKTVFEEKERGGYKQTTTTKHVNSDGTNVTLVTTTNVDVDKNGNVTTVAKSEKTVDPKGLMNKKTTTDETKMVNGKVVERNQKSD